jgi:large subunit ribosomal protein L7/L12
MAEETKEIKLSAKLEKLMGEIETLTVLELADLVKALEEKFGVSAVAAAPVAAAAGGAEAAPAEEKTAFTVQITGDGGKKIQVLKAVRELAPDLSLLDAKKKVESLPFDVMTDVKKEEADAAVEKLKAAGAEVTLK